MSDWIDCMNALEPELLEVTIRSEKPTIVNISVKCSSRSHLNHTRGLSCHSCI